MADDIDNTKAEVMNGLASAKSKLKKYLKKYPEGNATSKQLQVNVDKLTKRLKKLTEQSQTPKRSLLKELMDDYQLPTSPSFGIPAEDEEDEEANPNWQADGSHLTNGAQPTNNVDHIGDLKRLIQSDIEHKNLHISQLQKLKTRMQELLQQNPANEHTPDYKHMVQLAHEENDDIKSYEARIALNSKRLNAVGITNEIVKPMKQSLMSELLEGYDITSKISRHILSEEVNVEDMSPAQRQRRRDILLHIERPTHEDRAELARLNAVGRAKVMKDPADKLKQEIKDAEAQKAHHVAHLKKAQARLHDVSTSDYLRRMINAITIPEQEKFIKKLDATITQKQAELASHS